LTPLGVPFLIVILMALPATKVVGFVSAAHTEADIAETVRVAGEVFKTL
jgi:glutamate-1-semialdehyde aminotransferase